MRKIIKGKEPKEWTEYRLTPGVDYQAIPELRQSLLKEQGYICAYCMRRIPCKDKNSNEDSRIDHILCQENNQDKKLNYQNMVICCPGAISNDFHCDKSKGAKDISFSPFDDDFISSLSYSSKTGEIKSTNEQWNREINEILNLNNAILKANRLDVINGIIVSIKHWNKSDYQRLFQLWENKDSSGFYKAYCGIVIWFLRKLVMKRQYR